MKKFETNEGLSLRSFFMGGFECSTHKDRHGRRLDLIASTRHDEFAEADYQRLADQNILTGRDGARWHLIEVSPYRYNFSSLESQIAAANKTGIQVIWDYFHYGYPDDLDIYSPQFIERFSAFCRVLTEYLLDQLDDTELIVCPVNEISFFSWIAGQVGVFHPASRRRGNALKLQLVRAALAAVDSIRSVSVDIRWMFCDPAIHVVPQSDSPQARKAAEVYRSSQFDAFDMIIGKRAPELGGDPSYLDIVGLNYYFHNQWRHVSRRKIPLGHPQYRPFEAILREYSERYRRPLIVAETGIEDDERPEWLRYVCEQSRIALAAGVPLAGICLYPIADHPGWADDRHCPNGLWGYADDAGDRPIYQPLADELREQTRHLASPVPRPEHLRV